MPGPQPFFGDRLLRFGPFGEEPQYALGDFVPEEQEKDRQADQLIVSDEIPERGNHADQHADRECEGHQAVNEEDHPLPGSRAALGLGARPEELPDGASHVSKGPLPEVGELDDVAQQIVSVELDQGIQIEKGLESGGGHDHRGGPVQGGLRIGHPPGQGGDSPEEELDEWSGEGHQDALVFFRKEPDVADVAVERGTEVHQQEAQLPDLAPNRLQLIP